jgi:putative ABC transport system ATP-binding protein
MTLPETTYEDGDSPMDDAALDDAAQADTPLYALDRVERIYRRGSVPVAALRGVSLTIERGEMVAVEGPSGSGKSTLLQLLGALDVPTAGKIRVDGVDLSAARDRELTRMRAAEIGFVFQQFNLIPTLSAADNVAVAMVPAGTPRSQRKARAIELLEQVGLGDRVDHLPSRLSGGEQQRVAIARALANDPHVILADEPTGNLDGATAQEIMGLLSRLVDERGVTVVVITHDGEVAKHARRRIRLRDGEVVSDTAA